MQSDEVETTAPDETAHYRPLSSTAVACFTLGLLSPLALVNWYLAAVPMVALLLGLRARWRIAQFPDEYTGLGLANVGLLLAAISWPAGWAHLGYEYLTEVPPGYQRISYAELQFDPATPQVPVPRTAIALDGKRVFLKGYVYPGPVQHKIQRFLLVRDNGTCCFGGSKPKLNDMIDVTLSGNLTLDYDTGVHKVAGTFRVAPQIGVDPSVGTVLYQLEADHLE